MIIVQKLGGELREVGRLRDHADADFRLEVNINAPFEFRGALFRLRGVGPDSPPFRSPVGAMITDSPEPVAEVISGGEYLDQVEGFERTANP